MSEGGTLRHQRHRHRAQHFTRFDVGWMMRADDESRFAILRGALEQFRLRLGHQHPKHDRADGSTRRVPARIRGVVAHRRCESGAHVSQPLDFGISDIGPRTLPKIFDYTRWNAAFAQRMFEKMRGGR